MMVRHRARRVGPSDAERIRSAMAAAESLSLTTDSRAYDLIGMHRVDDRGRLRLRAPADSPLAAEVASAPYGDVAALVELTDIAPTTLRERVRSRISLAGWLSAAARQPEPRTLVLDLDLAEATLDDGGPLAHVEPEDLAAAAPDVLATEEAAMLTHLEGGHRGVVGLLTRLVDPRPLRGAVRVVPAAMDRGGITLRCEYRGGRHEDVRVPFDKPVRAASEVGRQVELLLRRAHATHTCGRTTGTSAWDRGASS
jgi:hypothetical protein